MTSPTRSVQAGNVPSPRRDWGRYLFEQFPQDRARALTWAEQHAEKLAGRLGKQVVHQGYDIFVAPVTSLDPIHEIRLGNRDFKTLSAGPTIATILVGALGGRGLFAALRAPELMRPKDDKAARSWNPLARWWTFHDTREISDIMRRDVVTLSLMLFALDPIGDKLMIPWLQRLKGVRLMHPQSGRPLSFDQLKAAYHLATPDITRLVMADPMNRRGLAMMLKEGFVGLPRDAQVRATKSHIDRTFHTLAHQLHDYQLLGHVHHNSLSPQQAFNRLKTPGAIAALKAGQIHDYMPPLNELIDQSASSAWGALNQLDELLASKGLAAVNAREFISRYAMGSMAPAHLFAIALTVLGLGLGPVLYNKAVSGRDFEALLRTQEEANPNKPLNQLG